MQDVFSGKVIEVTDGDTFVMTVTHQHKENQYKYQAAEIIRIADIDEPELDTQAGKKSKEELKKELEGKNVEVKVQARDRYYRVVGFYKML